MNATTEIENEVEALPDGWSSVRVADALAKKRGANVTKLQTSEYLDHGRLPIFDQGAKFICGYTNKLDTHYSYELPVIVFGDHTRILKYVDFPFTIGTDERSAFIHQRTLITASFSTLTKKCRALSGLMVILPRLIVRLPGLMVRPYIRVIPEG